MSISTIASTLTALAVVLAGAAYYAWNTSGQPLSTVRSASPEPGEPRRTAAAGAPAVHLNALERSQRTVVEGTRNLFRYQPKALPPPPVARPAAAAVLQSAGPSGPPALPPIALKFIGVVERPARSERIAVLRDAAGHLLSGSEGGVIEGRFRILHIGTESIDMAYLDGRGRQTIRLSGG